MDTVKDPNTDDILDGKWRTAEDKENHERSGGISGVCN